MPSEQCQHSFLYPLSRDMEAFFFSQIIFNIICYPILKITLVFKWLFFSEKPREWGENLKKNQNSNNKKISLINKVLKHWANSKYKCFLTIINLLCNECMDIKHTEMNVNTRNLNHAGRGCCSTSHKANLFEFRAP